MSAMATVSTKLLTADEFYEFVHRPENAGRHFELERGEVIELPPPMKPHGFVCANVVFRLMKYAAEQNAGYVCSKKSTNVRWNSSRRSPSESASDLVGP